MIIYGWRTLESEVGQGGFRCPSCKTQQAYRQFSHRTWFTLYFLPVFPLGTENSYVQCQCCYSQFGKHALRSLPAAAESPIQAVLVEEPAHSKQPRIVQAPHARPAAPLSAGVQIPIAQPLGNVIPDAPRTSSLALASLILGLISPVLLCAFGLSLLSSLAAIVTGHLALYHLKREFPRLLGQTQAITGLVLGYVLLVASIGFWSLLLGPIFRDDNRPLAQAPDTNRERLLDAEMKVTGASGDDGAATGNTAAAEALARTYSEMLAKMRNAEFTPDRERKVTLSGGKFVVHCELHPGRCALLVHVPSYRDFDSDAKEELARRSWELAQELVTPELQPGDLLAVGLRGSLLYGSVMVGKVGGAPQDGFTGSERDDLIAFFPAPAAPAAEAPAKVAEEPPPAA
ncbi:MAG TPA: zinc-ribbon domain-containing protein, partial [Pirellulaceae bacterium]|nr:zinc-ribbon domain-containing protein [Pirellulaceae bacterium]